MSLSMEQDAIAAVAICNHYVHFKMNFCLVLMPDRRVLAAQIPLFNDVADAWQAAFNAVHSSLSGRMYAKYQKITPEHHFQRSNVLHDPQLLGKGPTCRCCWDADMQIGDGKLAVNTSTSLTASSAVLNGHAASHNGQRNGKAAGSAAPGSGVVLASGHAGHNGHIRQGSKDSADVANTDDEQGPAQLQLFDLIYSLVSLLPPPSPPPPPPPPTTHTHTHTHTHCAWPSKVSLD